MTLDIVIEWESTGINVNLVSPGVTKANLNGYKGLESVEEGSRGVVRVALWSAKASGVESLPQLAKIAIFPRIRRSPRSPPRLPRDGTP
jgi:hypothetical protein